MDVTKCIRTLIKMSKDMERIEVQSERVRNPVTLVLFDTSKRAVAGKSQISEFGHSIANAVSQQTDDSYMQSLTL